MLSRGGLTINLIKSFFGNPITELAYIFLWEWSICNCFISAQWGVLPVCVWVTDRYPVVTRHTIIRVVTGDWGDNAEGIVVLRNIFHYNVKYYLISRSKIYHLF